MQVFRELQVPGLANKGTQPELVEAQLRFAEVGRVREGIGGEGEGRNGGGDWRDR